MKKIFITILITLCLFPVQQIPHVYGAIGEGAPTFYQQEGDKKVLPTVTGGYSIAPTEDVLDDIIVGVINQVSNVFIGFSVLFIVVAGVQYVLAQGDEEKIKKAHKSILWSVLGVLLIMLSYTIIFVINTIF